MEKLNRLVYLLYCIMESAQQSQVVDVTSKAAEKVIEFMKQEGKDNLFLRVYVTGGGCSGLSMEWVLKKSRMKMMSFWNKTVLKF